MWFKKYWPALLALALQVESLWKFLKWALDWRGRYDTLANTYHEVGGVGAVIGYILDPPPWFYPLAFVAGVILIWWNFHRDRQQASAEILPPRDPAARDSTPRGTKLITAGIIVLIVGIVGGAVLIITGIFQNSERRSEAPNAVAEPTKTPVAQSAPAPVVEAPIIQSSPAPIVQAPITTPPVAITPPPIPPAKPPRKYVDAHVTPEFLMGLYKGNTALRAEKLISEETGKWMPVSGPMGEIHPGGIMFNGERGPTLVVFAPPKQVDVYMWFSGEWVDRLAILSKNQNISVIGQIKKVTDYNTLVELENCELRDNPDPMTNAPTQSPNSSTRPRRRRSSTVKRPSQG